MMMAVAEVLHPDGTWLGAIVTFLFYGLLPTGLVMYVMGTPLRRKARLAREAQSLPSSPEQPETQPETGLQQSSSQTQAAMRPVLPSDPASRR